MQTDEQMANALFGKTSPRPTNTDTSPRPATAAVTDEQAIAALYPADVEVRRTLDQKDGEMFATLGATSTQRAEIANTFVGLARAGVPAFVVNGLAESFINGEAAQAADPTAYATAMQQQTATARRELRATLAAEHTPAGAEALLRRTEQYIATVPGLATILASHGLGSSKHFKAILEHVRRNGLGL